MWSVHLLCILACHRNNMPIKFQFYCRSNEIPLQQCKFVSIFFRFGNVRVQFSAISVRFFFFLIADAQSRFIELLWHMIFLRIARSIWLKSIENNHSLGNDVKKSNKAPFLILFIDHFFLSFPFLMLQHCLEISLWALP